MRTISSVLFCILLFFASIKERMNSFYNEKVNVDDKMRELVGEGIQ